MSATLEVAMLERPRVARGAGETYGTQEAGIGLANRRPLVGVVLLRVKCAHTRAVGAWELVRACACVRERLCAAHTRAVLES